MKNAYFVSLLLFLILVSNVRTKTLELGCKECDGQRKCPTLPVDCERDRRPCGCCDECAGNLDALCSAYTVRCASGLMCVNGRGEALEAVPWYMDSYKGTCQNVVVNPVVIENTEIEERRYTG